MPSLEIDGLADAVIGELEKFGNETIEDLKDSVKETAKQCVKEIKAGSPKKTGSYKKGWGYKVMYESGSEIRVLVRNRTDGQLTHLLENGHAKRNGGRVEGRPHIAPAEKNAEKNLVDNVKMAVKLR